MRDTRLAGTASLLVLALVAGESLPRPPLWNRLPEEKDFPAVYGWLRDTSEIRAYAELPLRTDTQWLWQEAGPMYFATLHWKPIFNGYSSFLPPLYLARARRAAGLPSPAGLAELRALGIDAVMVRKEEVGRRPRSRLERLRRERTIRTWVESCVAHGARQVYGDERFDVLLISGIAAASEPDAALPRAAVTG